MLKVNRIKMVMTIFLMVSMFLAFTMVSYASANYGENGAKIVLDNVFWVVLTITVMMSIAAWMKHATVFLVMTMIIGGMIAFFCKYPEKIAVVGESLAKAIFVG